MTLRRKLGWVAVLYFAEGLPFGVVKEVMPVYLRFSGVDLPRRGVGLRARFLEGGPGRAGTRTADTPSGGGEAIAGLGDDHGIGMLQRDIERRRPVAIHAHGVGEQRVERALHLRIARTGMVANSGRGRLPGDLPGVRPHPGMGEREDRASAGFGEQGDGAASGVDATGDDHRSQGGTGGRLERRFPTVVDLDQVEERAEHAVDAGESLDARLGARVVEGEGKRVGACRLCQIVQSVGGRTGSHHLRDDAFPVGHGAGQHVFPAGETRLTSDRQPGVFVHTRIGGSLTTVDQRHLAKEITLSIFRKRDFVSVLVGDTDTHTATLDQIHRIARIAFAKKPRAARRISDA